MTIEELVVLLNAYKGNYGNVEVLISSDEEGNTISVTDELTIEPIPSEDYSMSVVLWPGKAVDE